MPEFADLSNHIGCYPINPPLAGNVRSVHWCPGGIASLTVYDQTGCKGNEVWSGPSEKGSQDVNLQNINARSFRIAGGWSTCLC